MKKLISYSLCLLFILLSCQEKKETEPLKEKTKVLRVYVSSYPLYFFANSIGNEKIDLHFPAMRASSPANWKPITDTIASMQQADVIFLNGADFENWLMNVSLPNNKVVVTTDQSKELLLESGKTYSHSHGEGGSHKHTAKARTTWMDLSLAIKQAEVIKNELVRLQPENESYFEENFEQLQIKLSELDEEFRQAVAENSEVYIAFSHPEYQYFQKAYGLKGESLHWEPNQILDKEMLHDVEHLIKSKKISAIIWEDQPLQESVESLEKLGVKSIVISPILSTPDSINFIHQLEINLNNLKLIYQ